MLPKRAHFHATWVRLIFSTSFFFPCLQIASNYEKWRTILQNRRQLRIYSKTQAASPVQVVLAKPFFTNLITTMLSI